MYIIEDGKKYYQWESGLFTRSHDDNFQGRRFEYKRCPFCQRITCIHSLHLVESFKEMCRSEI